ncbi:hypothetical protein G9A89_006732 [Geosiphon pyriformis]|nr:hypothetical protein G9A89_006732 [Geosiphon pyriformis]
MMSKDFLPNEVLAQVFSYLPSRILECNLMRVNRNFRVLAHNTLSNRVDKAFKERGYHLVLETSCTSSHINELIFLFMEDSPRCHFSFASVPPQYIFSTRTENSFWINLVRMHPIKTDKIKKVYMVSQGQMYIDMNIFQATERAIEFSIDDCDGSQATIKVKFLGSLRPDEFTVEVQEIIINADAIFCALEEEEKES